MRTCLESCLIAVLIAGCSAAGWRGDGHGITPKERKRTPLIPRSVLFGEPDKLDPRISLDGSKLAYLAKVDGVMNLWVGPLDDPAAAKPVTKDEERGIREHRWAFNNRHILYLQDKNSDGNWHVYAMDVNTNETVDLTPIDGVQPQIQGSSHKFPNEILIAINDRNPRLHDIYRVNIETAERKSVLQNREYIGFTTDDDFRVGLAWKGTLDGGAEFFKATGEGDDWTSFMRISLDDARTTGSMGFDRTGKILYMADSSGRDTTALVAYNLETDERKVIASDPRANLDHLLSHPTEKTIEAVAFTFQRREWKILDDSIKADFDYLKTVADGDLTISSRTLDDKHWIVAYLMDDGPVRFYHYDRAAGKAKFLFTDRKELEGLPLARMHPLVIKSRDGLDLVSYLSLPVGADDDGDGRPEKPVPMVLMVHPGPWARSTWGYNSMAQWLANRGYAALSVNYRGSAGFGENFLNAGRLEWGRKMHDDLIDAVNWAIDRKIADPKRIAIIGVAYGGYGVLTGLTMTPNVFACGVDICGPSNLIALLESIPPRWRSMVSTFTSRVGDHRTKKGRALLTERSPLTHVDRISKPLLIAHGARDPRVRQTDTEQIVKTLEEKNIPVTYALFNDEGHGLVRPENGKAFSAVAEAFLAKHLGGRYEPIGDDFKGSSISVPKGADQVPGLTDALTGPFPEED